MTTRRSLWFLLLALPGTAAAAAEPLDGLRVLEVFAGLAVVLVAVVGLAAIVKRINVLKPAGGQQLRILESLPLGTREKLVLVEVNGEPLLLGLAPGRIEALHAPAAAKPEPAAPDYASVEQEARAGLGLPESTS